MNDYVCVDMCDMKCSDGIIGTTALAPCFGVLLYNRELKKAIVTHSVSDNINLPFELEVFSVESGIKSDDLEYRIIPGYDITDSNTRSMNEVRKYFVQSGYSELNINDGDIVCKYISPSEGYHEFLFDARTGEFVTSKYSEISNEGAIK